MAFRDHHDVRGLKDVTRGACLVEDLNTLDLYVHSIKIGNRDITGIKTVNPRFKFHPSVYYDAVSKGDIDKFEWLVDHVGTFSESVNDLVFGHGYKYLSIPEITPFEPIYKIRYHHMLTAIWKYVGLSGSTAMVDLLDRHFHEFRPKLLDVLCTSDHSIIQNWSGIVAEYMFPDIEAEIEKEIKTPRSRPQGDHYKCPAVPRERFVFQHALNALVLTCLGKNKYMAKWLAKSFPEITKHANAFAAVAMAGGDISALELLHKVMVDDGGPIEIDMRTLHIINAGSLADTRPSVSFECIRWLNEHRPGKLTFYLRQMGTGKIKPAKQHHFDQLRLASPEIYKYLTTKNLIPSHT